MEVLKGRIHDGVGETACGQAHILDTQLEEALSHTLIAELRTQTANGRSQENGLVQELLVSIGVEQNQFTTLRDHILPEVGIVIAGR